LAIAAAAAAATVSTAATIAAATASSASSAAIAAAAAAATAGRPVFTRAGFVNRQRPALEVLGVKQLNGLFRVLLRAHLDEGKPA